MPNLVFCVPKCTSKQAYILTYAKDGGYNIRILNCPWLQSHSSGAWKPLLQKSWFQVFFFECNKKHLAIKKKNAPKEPQLLCIFPALHRPQI